MSVEALRVERGGRIVIRRLSLILRAGEAILVRGRNGAGKSTLLRTIAGLLPVSAGHVAFGFADAEVRGVETVHYLGYDDALKPSLSVGENLAFWAAILRPPAIRTNGSFWHSNVGVSPVDALAAFGIARLIDLPAAYLSAGQKRRVALARLLLAPRPIWLLDEPLIALDTSAQTSLTEIMSGHLGQGGAILVASHQPLALPYREIDLAAPAA